MTNDEPQLPRDGESHQGSDVESVAVGMARVNSLRGHEFETLVEQLLSKMGFRVEGRQAAADGGVDMVALKSDAILGGKFIVQCKRLSVPVGNSAIRDLFGVVHAESANKGLLITNSTFTREATRFADGKPLELIDGAALQKLLLQHGMLSSAVSDGNAEPSPGVLVLHAQLVIPLQRIMDESKQVASGLIFLPKQNIDGSRWITLFQRHSNELSGLLVTLPALLPSTSAIISDPGPSTEDLARLRGHATEIIRMASALLKLQKEACSVAPPDEYSAASVLHSRVGPALLNRIWSFAECIQGVVDGSIHGPKVALNLDLNIPEIDAITEEIGRIQADMDEPTARCFIATAAYSSDTDARVVELRAFRDDFLRPNRLGAILIAVYEWVSPSLAKIIATKESLRLAARAFLSPIVVVITLINKIGRAVRPPSKEESRRGK